MNIIIKTKMIKDEDLYKFTLSEFDSRDALGSGKKMNKEFLLLLSNIRKELGRAMIINSGYRTKSHNEKVGGSPNSSHIKGLAVDVHVPDNQFRLELVRLALKHGIRRIGIYKTFVHLDVDSDKVQSMWYL